jgi:3-oxoacyl-[acyl-carrier protein] reductase
MAPKSAFDHVPSRTAEQGDFMSAARMLPICERPVAIVTGAATGIGAATASWLAARGRNVIVNYRQSAAAAADVVANCRSHGVEAHAIAGDVSLDADCRLIAAAAITRWGRIDVLVNSAGTTLFRPMTDLGALSAQDFENIYRVNVIGPYQMTRAVAVTMRLTGGAIVNVSSIAGTSGTGSSYAYAASKGALNTLTRALARNLAPEITVNAVLPGMVQGRWLLEGVGEAAYAATRDNFARESALGVVATPEQVAEIIGWLATKGTIITGELITIDAGLSLGRPPKVESRVKEGEK